MGEFFPPKYPLCMGHEVIGRITKLGNNIKINKKGLKVNDLVCFGWYRDSC